MLYIRLTEATKHRVSLLYESVFGLHRPNTESVNDTRDGEQNQDTKEDVDSNKIDALVWLWAVTGREISCTAQ